MIKIKNICKEFNGKPALKNINMEIKDGETLAVIGGSGSGKSTLLRLMIGLIRPTSGELWIGDQEISHLSDSELDKVRLRMGMVFQYSALFDSMTVGDNVAFGLREHTKLSEKEIRKNRLNFGLVFQDFNLLDTFTLQDNIFLPLVLSGTPYSEMEDRIKPLARQLGIEMLLDKFPYEVSGGQKQRTAVARALITNPKLVLADEPTRVRKLLTKKISKNIKKNQINNLFLLFF